MGSGGKTIVSAASKFGPFGFEAMVGSGGGTAPDDLIGNGL